MNTFCPPTIIETDELRLRPFTDADADALFDALLGDPSVTEWLPFPTHRNAEETRTFIRSCRLGWSSRTCFTWAMEDRDTGRLVAAIELQPTPPRAEIGVITSRREGHRRRRAGLATLLKLIGWLLAQPQLCRIHAYCAPEGDAASTMTRLGFTLEAKLVNWEPRPNRNLAAGDALLFAITRAPHESPPAFTHRVVATRARRVPVDAP
ncbi:GNAT family N-acetyltransferase [Paraburkholderia rhizosphaerae]|uniref:RimJ/RimL family protein N-acetyltransferase n=1 Tax=Paraburkholderia rhizosphaerae TaxID=480658 RepID=A0A4R8LHP1_9BURK|nr:GNAT family N-acetyltransferase [Paraburkholderia rhizosphaerae]TDY42752.1 RimJ/RimL family protein N-acetyltransferase [Paraburkholderia rhizosphaerae]